MTTLVLTANKAAAIPRDRDRALGLQARSSAAGPTLSEALLYP